MSEASSDKSGADFIEEWMEPLSGDPALVWIAEGLACKGAAEAGCRPSSGATCLEAEDAGASGA